MKNVFLDHIRKQETRFEDRALYDAMSDGFVILAADTLEIEYSNKSFEDFESDFERERVVSLLMQLVKGEISEEELAASADYSKVGLKNVNLSDGTDAFLIVLVKNLEMPFRGHYQILNEAEVKMNMGTWQYLLADDKLSVSRGMAHLFGYEEDEIQNFANSFEGYLSFVIDEDKGKIIEALEEIRQSNSQVLDLEHKILDREGQEKLLSISTLKILTNKGKAIGAQGIVRGITEIRKHELAVEENIKKLNASNEALSEFAYTASHDLQEPLRKIEAYGDRLQNSLGQEISEKSDRYLSKMLQATKRMSDLIDDILKLSRLSSVSITPEKINLEEVFQGIVSDYEETIDRTQAEINYSLPEIIGSRTQFHQLFQNLLSNSLKFKKEEVVPKVEVAYRKAKKEDLKKLGINSRKDFYEITFEDNGIGFEQQFENKVFAPFKRLFGRSEFPGTGIGLAIAKKVVENHGGLIQVKSQEGKGTTFMIYIPTP